MGRRRNRETILKTMFDKRPILNRVSQKVKDKKGKEQTINVGVPMIGKIEVDGYNCFIGSYEMFFDATNSYSQPFNEKLATNRNLVKKVLDDAKLNNTIRVEIDRKTLSDYYKKYKSIVPYIIETENFKIGVHPEYLLNILDWCGSDFVNVDSPVSPILTWSDNYNNMAIALPRRI